MRRFGIPVGLGCFLLALAGHAGGREGSPDRARAGREPERAGFADRLKGEWDLQTRVVMGKRMDDQPGLRLVVSDRYLSIIRAREWRPAEAVSAEYYRVDPTTDPPRLDTTGRADWTEVHEGICRLEGDILTVCFAEPGKPRPTAFVTGEGAGRGQVLMTFKRRGKGR